MDEKALKEAIDSLYNKASEIAVDLQNIRPKKSAFNNDR
jgi:hypothetical protein